MTKGVITQAELDEAVKAIRQEFNERVAVKTITLRSLTGDYDLMSKRSLLGDFVQNLLDSKTSYRGGIRSDVLLKRNFEKNMFRNKAEISVRFVGYPQEEATSLIGWLTDILQPFLNELDK